MNNKGEETRRRLLCGLVKNFLWLTGANKKTCLSQTKR